MFLALVLLLITPTTGYAEDSIPLTPEQIKACENLNLTTLSNPNQTLDSDGEATSDTGDQIRVPKPIIPIGCQRPFLFHDQFYSVDTPRSQDAGNLKSFVSSVPKAKELLEQYESNRNKSIITAYTGTLGLLLFLFAGPISQRFSAGSQASVKSAANLGGLTLMAGSFLYGFTLLRTNEYLIPRAVDAYNQQAKPNDQITLQFTAGFGF
jgi:hypothetical protein